MPLTRGKAWTYYTACYLPSVCYPLTASFLTSLQLNKIQMRAMSSIIPRCGYNRNTHRSIICGPQQLGGAGFRHLATERGTMQVTYFLRHWKKQSQVGRLFRCVLSWLQLSVGVSFPVLEQPTQTLPHDESKWLSSLRSVLTTQKLSIRLDEPGIPPLQRTHDSYLMDHILQSNHYTAAEVRKLNYCRLYLNVVTVSDITQPNDNSVDPSFYTGHLAASSSRPNLMSVHQERPSEQEWKLWRRAHLLWCNRIRKRYVTAPLKTTCIARLDGRSGMKPAIQSLQVWAPPQAQNQRPIVRKAYGMLSIMRFLIRIAEFTEMSFQWQGVLGTDSQSLLDTPSGKD
jgi:hypothetical protein